MLFCCVLYHQKGYWSVGWLTDWVSCGRTHCSPHGPLLVHRWSPDYKYELLWEGGGQTTTLVLHAGCRDGSVFKSDRIRRRHAGKNTLPWRKCQKTVCCLPIHSSQSAASLDELPSPPCSSTTPISNGLFVRMGRKIQRGWKDRNPFVSLGCDYLHGDEGPECSAVFRCESQTIEPVFVLLQEVWEGLKRGEKKKRGGRQRRGLRIVRTMRIRFCYCGDWIAFQYQGI